MDHLEKIHFRVSVSLFVIIACENLVTVGSFWGLRSYAKLNDLEALSASLALGLAMALISARLFGDYVVQPLKALWQIIVNLSPTDQSLPPFNSSDLKLGRELVTSLSAQIYQLTTAVSQTADENRKKTRDLQNNFIAQNLPLPMIVLGPDQAIHFANEAAARYVGIAVKDMIGKNIYMVLDMSFPNEDTFDVWLNKVKVESATAVYNWERVRLNVHDNRPAHLFDLSAYYNRDNTDKNEVILVLFDHTKMYSQEDQAISFMALSVHELRTPLTLLRGYIEVFEDELEQSINPELKGFMLKMHAQAEQLTDYVSNILNVARIDDDQLELKLQSESWDDILKSSIEMMGMRARVRGITLKCQLVQGLPPVAADRIGIGEVVSNLIDNAIKYSGKSKVIRIRTYLNNEGLVETTVQDSGRGIPANILPNLFTKFYRDHHNRAQIGGTGLGLYLCKAIITAHGGNIWVRSREGEGSTFGFTLIPYAQLAETLKHKDDEGITRSAHGWIKNHSLYRR